MTERHVVSLLMLHSGTPRDQRARAELVAALSDDAEAAEPDAAGAFDVTLEADDFDDALKRVRDAIATSGTDDHILLIEHPPGA
jgi:hypothetical protein